MCGALGVCWRRCLAENLYFLVVIVSASVNCAYLGLSKIFLASNLRPSPTLFDSGYPWHSFNRRFLRDKFNKVSRIHQSTAVPAEEKLPVIISQCQSIGEYVRIYIHTKLTYRGIGGRSAGAVSGVQSETTTGCNGGSSTSLSFGWCIPTQKRTIIIIFSFCQPYHDADDEPEAAPLDPSFFDFDLGEPLSKEELKGVSLIVILLD